jgi:hypothetical protein
VTAVAARIVIAPLSHGLLSQRMQSHGSLEGAISVVRKQRRHLQRDPAAGGVVNGTEQIRGLRQILDSKLEKQRLACFPSAALRRMASS